MKKDCSNLAVKLVPIGALSERPRNPRTHSKRQVQQIARCIEQFGFNVPILVDCANQIIAGHGRLAAARLLGMESVPVIPIEHLSAEQTRAFLIADNRLSERAGWDTAMLAVELQDLITIDPTFDVTVTGFEIPEVDSIIEQASGPKPASGADVIPSSQGDLATSRPGDLWLLGRHHLLCGNSLASESYETLMAGKRGAAVFSDPPFNVRIDGHASGNGSIHHDEFLMASGEMSEAEFVAFPTTSFGLLSRYTTQESVHFICMDWRHTGDLLAAGRQVYDSLLNLCVWVKDNGGMGSFYRSQHELVFVFRNGKGRHRNNVQLGKFGRNRTNVWRYSGLNSESKRTDEGNLLSPPSHGQASSHGCRCHPRFFCTWRHHFGRLYWIRNDACRGRAGRSYLLRD